MPGNRSAVRRRGADVSGQFGSRDPSGPPHLLMEREIVVGRFTAGVTSTVTPFLHRYDTRWDVNALFDTIWSLGQGPWLSRNAYPAAEPVTDPG